MALIERLTPPREAWRKPPVMAVLALNLVPAVCVLWFGWSTGLLFLLYWIENVVIGVFQALKMIIASFTEGVGGVLGTTFFFVPFFIVHYGGFCLGHLMFVLMFVFMEQGGPNPEALDTPDQLPAFFEHLGRSLGADGSGFALSLAAIVAVQAMSFFVDFIGKGQWRKDDPGELMGAVYGRIIVLHLTLLLTGLVLAEVGDPRLGIFVLAILKTGFDAWGEAGRQARGAGA